MNLETRLPNLPANPQRIDFVSALRRIPAILLRWYGRIEERRRLHELSDELLRDVGLSRSQIQREAAKPFWRE